MDSHPSSLLRLAWAMASWARSLVLVYEILLALPPRPVAHHLNFASVEWELRESWGGIFRMGHHRICAPSLPG